MECFETCPLCSQDDCLSSEQMKPMVLCGLDEGMQCDVCNNSFKLPDCEDIIEVARQQRERRYAKD